MDPNSNNKSASPLGGVVAGTVERYGHVVSDTCLVTNPCLGRQPSACAKHYSQPPKYEATMYGRKSRSDRSTVSVGCTTSCRPLSNREPTIAFSRVTGIQTKLHQFEDESVVEPRIINIKQFVLLNN